MALQTLIRTVFCIFALKIENKSFPLCLRMLFSRAMAGFAFTYPMGIFLKKIIDVRMAFLTGFGPYIPLLLRFHLFLTK